MVRRYGPMANRGRTGAKALARTYSLLADFDFWGLLASWVHIEHSMPAGSPPTLHILLFPLAFMLYP